MNKAAEKVIEQLKRQSKTSSTAKSETIITGGHSIQETPQAVLTLRKILRQHLRDYPIENK